MKIPEFKSSIIIKILICLGNGETMSGESKMIANLKGQLSKFSGIISNG
ncbi:MAG: hypothetical protein ACOYU0_01770 [Nitrospirota bacterium]